MRPRILFLVPSDYNSLKTKSILHMIYERDDGGFFDHVATVHPVTRTTQIIHLNDIHTIYEIGLDIFPGFEKFRLFRLVQGPFHFFRVILKVAALIKKEKIQLIRATDPYWMGFIAWIESKLTGFPFCISIHADYDKRYILDPDYGAPKILGSRRFAKYLERFVLSRAKMVMPIRKHLEQQAVKNGANPKAIRIIPHGIDMTLFKQQPKTDIYQFFKLNRNLKIISFIGRLSNENYVDDILELGARLAKLRSDFIIVMVGGGNEENRLRRLVANNPDLNRFIRLVGFQPREISLDIRRASTIALCLMGGFSLIEACAAGRPVVAYDVEWHHELVKDNQTGFLVKEHNIEELVKKVAFLMDHPKEANRMGKNAQALVFEKHDIEKTSAIKRQCYEELLASGDTLTKRQNDPKTQIAISNRWYTDDQFSAQLGTPGRRTVIENRWRIFENALSEWTKKESINKQKMDVHILDAGCGDGISLFGLSQIVETLNLDAKLFGIDYNALRITRASRIKGVIGLQQGSLYALPFANGVFEVIICNHVLEHIPDDQSALNEIHRVLKDYRIFILGVPNEGCLIAQLRNHIVQPGIARTTDHVNFYTEETIGQRLQDAGFRILHIEREGFFTPHLRLNSIMVERGFGRKTLNLLQQLISI